MGITVTKSWDKSLATVTTDGDGKSIYIDQSEADLIPGLVKKALTPPIKDPKFSVIYERNLAQGYNWSGSSYSVILTLLRKDVPNWWTTKYGAHGMGLTLSPYAATTPLVLYFETMGDFALGHLSGHDRVESLNKGKVTIN